MAESEHPAVELHGFRSAELGDRPIQLRFDAFVADIGAADPVPTLTLSRGSLSHLGTKRKLLVSDLPMVGGQ